MNTTVGVVNVLMGFVYLAYGTMTLVDLRSGGWSDHTRRHFGLAFLAIMFTCGPHHTEHGLHLLVDGGEGAALDLWVVAIGLLPGGIWFALRVEAMRGGTGDRFIEGTPGWWAAVPVATAGYLVATVALAGQAAAGGTFDGRVTVNLVIMVLYFAISAVLLGTQFRNNAVTGRWSVSGAALAGVFLTCALMHLVYASFGVAGDYRIDGHILAIDVVAIPGAAYFLSMVWRVHRRGAPEPTAVERQSALAA